MANTKQIVEQLIADWKIIKPLRDNETNELFKQKYTGMLEQITRTFGYKLREDIYENYPELVEELQSIGLDKA
jgi:hypothetical protein